MVVQEDDTGGSGSPAPRKHRLRQRFDVQKKLGQGTYGKVQLAVNKETGQEVAIKTIKKSKIESEQDLIRIRREIQIMSSIQHPHIIHIYEVFENKDKIVLVMQYASGGELYDYLSDKKVLDDKEARRIFRQIAAAVYYCHKNKICHRDLKLENVLIDDKGNAKLADFGLSNVFDDRHHLSTFCGSPLYASPEIVKGVPYYGPEVDCWSLGVLLFTLVYGSMPFDGTNFKRLVRQISEGEFYEPETKSGASPLIHWLLKGEPGERATIVDICSDPWINDGYDTSLLQLAEDLANLTPVRLDLLVALAPVSPSPSAKNLATEDEDTTTDTQASQSFTYVGDLENNPSVENFLPTELALEELDAELAGLDPATVKRQADGSLARISSTAHHTKKPKKSESAASTQNEADKEDDDTTAPEFSPESSRTKVNDWEKTSASSLRNSSDSFEEKKLELNANGDKSKSPITSPTSLGRPPQKLVMPKPFLSESTSTPPVPKNSPEAERTETLPFKSSADSTPSQQPQSPTKEDVSKTKQNTKAAGEGSLSPDDQNLSDEQKKLLAKGILKKNIAKAKLIERKLSQQSSVESDVSNLSTPEPAHPEAPLPSYIKAPKPFVKNERKETKLESRAEIVLSPTDTLKSSQGSLESNSEESPKHSKSYSRESIQSQGETLWEKRIDETLKKIAPEGVHVSTKRKDELKKPTAPPPIARSYRKFTFTKDGACITETRKVYCNPNEGGGWTKVEKKTTITHRSNAPPELPDESILKRSDSQSSSGSNDVVDDIFDSWTGDSNFCNIMKMKSMFNKLTRDTSDSFFRKPSREGSFTTMYDKKEQKLRDASDGSDVEDEFPFHLNDSMPVMYGSQGLSRLLRSINKDMPRRFSPLLKEGPSLMRTSSKESYSKRSTEHESRVHSNYSPFGSNIRSMSRERTKEPYFHVRLESPLSGKMGHRDSGVESWDESDYPSAAKNRYTLREAQIRRQGSKDDSLFESPRHRVEQWLHMSDAGDAKIAAETPSTMYGTIRPRNRYSHRSSSDKLSDRDAETSYRTEVRLDRDGQVRKSTFSRTTSEASRSSDEVVLERRQSAGSYTGIGGGPLATDGVQRPGIPVVHMTVSFNRDSPPVVITSTTGRTPFVPRMTIHHETRGKDDACSSMSNASPLLEEPDSPSEGTLTPDSLDTELHHVASPFISSDSLENLGLWPKSDHFADFNKEMKQLEEEQQKILNQFKRDAFEGFNLKNRRDLTQPRHALLRHLVKH